MLDIFLRKAMQERGLSSRNVADALGMSHSTILRALKGEVIDLDTVLKLAHFFNVRPSDLLNSMSTDATFPDQLAALLSHSPELEQELTDAVERVRAGSLDPNVIKEIVSYARYRLNQAGAPNVATKPPRSRKQVA